MLHEKHEQNKYTNREKKGLNLCMVLLCSIYLLHENSILMNGNEIWKAGG